jgi:hypothetical protein
MTSSNLLVFAFVLSGEGFLTKPTLERTFPGVQQFVAIDVLKKAMEQFF